NPFPHGDLRALDEIRVGRQRMQGRRGQEVAANQLLIGAAEQKPAWWNIDEPIRHRRRDVDGDLAVLTALEEHGVAHDGASGGVERDKIRAGWYGHVAERARTGRKRGQEPASALGVLVRLDRDPSIARDRGDVEMSRIVPAPLELTAHV